MLEPLTTTLLAVISSNMKSVRLLNERIGLGDTSFVELVIWQLPHVTRERPHGFKYRLALVSEGVCVMRYDNEAGKGDHRHLGGIECDYIFAGLEQLQLDFWADVQRWRLE